MTNKSNNNNNTNKINKYSQNKDSDINVITIITKIYFKRNKKQTMKKKQTIFYFILPKDNKPQQ